MSGSNGHRDRQDGESTVGIRTTGQSKLLTVEELVAFEQDIADVFLAGKIRAPVHLSGGNELELLRIFREVHPEDWVCSTWRSHYHALLHGIPPEKVKAQILEGNSITLQFPEHKFMTSAIVGGIIPIANGLALGLKRQKSPRKVWCFIGDMTSTTGIFHENLKLAVFYNLPITFIIEDNGKGVMTPTKEAWQAPASSMNWDLYGLCYGSKRKVRHYTYEAKWPHVGCGKWVSF